MGFASLEVWATQPLFMWQTALDQFLSYFEPCSTIEESTNAYTTMQLMKMLEQHCGAHFTTEEFTNYLILKGFKYAYNLDLNFEWLFKQKHPL